MSIEENKAIIFHMVEEFNKGNVAVIDECFDEHFIRYQDGSTPTFIPTMDRKGYKNFVSAVYKSSPDLQVKINNIVAEGDRLAFRWTLTGTDTKEAIGKSPTRKPTSVIEDYFVRFVGGKIVEFRNLFGGASS